MIKYPIKVLARSAGERAAIVDVLLGMGHRPLTPEVTSGAGYERKYPFRTSPCITIYEIEGFNTAHNSGDSVSAERFWFQIFPFLINPLPKTTPVKLTEKYTAICSKDGAQVSCTFFPAAGIIQAADEIKRLESL